MKFRRLDSFKSDHKRLKTEHKKAFAAVVLTKFAPACDAWAAAMAERTSYVWPATLRVDELRQGNGVMEMTWSFASPDGRATFQFVREGQGPGAEWFCVWRRTGDHSVYDDA